VTSRGKWLKSLPKHSKGQAILTEVVCFIKEKELFAQIAFFSFWPVKYRAIRSKNIPAMQIPIDATAGLR